MTTLLLSTLLLLTIIAAFLFGIAMGYWVICGILNVFSPKRADRKIVRTPAFAPTASGD